MRLRTLFIFPKTYMTLAIKRAGTKFTTHKTSDKGEPVGVALNTFDTLELAQTSAGSVKCWDDMDYGPYVPYSATTLKEALDAQAAQHRAHEVSEVASMYKQLVDRVLGNSEIKDKPKAVLQLAEDFAKWLEEPAEMKSVTPPLVAVSDHSVIKSLTSERIGGYAVIWGNEGKRDLTDQFFTTKTAELTAIFDAVGRLPWMYHHAMDNTVKTRVSGVVDVLKADSIGLWYEAQLKLADEYDEYIKQMLASGRLKTSSQTFPASFEWNKSTGEITRWAIVEITGTPTPAEYRMPVIEILKSEFAEIGVTDFDKVSNYSQRVIPNRQGAEKARLGLELARLS